MNVTRTRAVKRSPHCWELDKGPILCNDFPFFERNCDGGVLAMRTVPGSTAGARYTIAARDRVKALTILTVSDHLKAGDKDGPDSARAGSRRHGAHRLGHRDRRRRLKAGESPCSSTPVAQDPTGLPDNYPELLSSVTTGRRRRLTKRPELPRKAGAPSP